MSSQIPRTTKTQDPAKASPAKRLAKSELTACAFPSSQELLQALPAEMRKKKPNTKTLCQYARQALQASESLQNSLQHFSRQSQSPKPVPCCRRLRGRSMPRPRSTQNCLAKERQRWSSHLCKVAVLVQHILVVQQCKKFQHGLQDHAGQGYAY